MIRKFLAGLSALFLTLLPLHGVVSAATLANPIANPLISAATGSTPTGWSQATWTSVAGSITPTFDYITNDGHGDSTSVKVTMANYDTTYVAGAENGTQGGALTGDDGDAKWVFDPVTIGTGANQLQTGKQYRFNAWYKTNTIPKIVADYIDASGKETFFGMPAPQPAANSATTWTKYSDTFSIPQGTTAVTIFMFLDHNGWVQTDDYSIEDYTPTGFSEPLLSLTFDDGHEDNVANLLPLLTQYGYKSTQCFETGTILADPAQSESNVKAFYNAGHEICSHTITHPMLTQINDTQLTKELTESKTFLESIIGKSVPDFASPYGDYNAHVNDAIKAAGYASHRTVDEGFNSKDNFDPYRIRVQNIFYDSASTKTTTAAQVAAWIAQAKADNTWLVLVLHRVVDTTKAGQAGYEAPGPYDTSVDMMKQYLEAIKASSIKVATLADALAETKAQLGGPVTPPVTKVGDLTGDGKVDDDDATILFANWGSSPKAGDIDKNGVVNDDDATLLFANWSK